MDAAAFDVKRFVRPTLLAITLYLSVIVITSMTMVKPAQASGSVNLQSTYCVVFYYIGGFVAHACSSSYSAACSKLDGASFFSAACGNLCVIDNSCRTPAYVGYDQNYNSTSSCPANSTGTPATNPTTCTCNSPTALDPTNYVPDATATSCIPAACPDHASGTPCVCEAGYEFDPTVAYCVSICPVSDLPPITDPEVQAFEDNPDLSDTARLTARMGMNQNPSGALRCLLTAAAAGSPTVGSAFRPPAYNQHLIDVWRKWVNELKRNTNPVCADMKLKIQTHFQRHKLKVSQGPVPGSLHTLGEAVDVTISLPPANIDALAAGCQLRRPLPVTDSVHFIHQ